MWYESLWGCAVVQLVTSVGGLRRLSLYEKHELGSLRLVAKMSSQIWSYFWSSNNSNVGNERANSSSAWGLLASINQSFALKSSSRLSSTGTWLAVWDCIRTLTASKILSKEEVLSTPFSFSCCSEATELDSSVWISSPIGSNSWVFQGCSSLDKVSGTWWTNRVRYTTS